MRWCPLLFSLFYTLGGSQDSQTIRALFVVDIGDDVPERAMQAAMQFLNDNSELYGLYINATSVPADGFVDEGIISTLCQKYNVMIENSEPPHILIDATLAGTTSDAIKAFAAALGLPTISTSFGHDNDLREWRMLNEYQKKYLVQVLRPNDVIHCLIRSIAIRQNMTNAAILFDKTVALNHRFQSIFVNTGISFTFLTVNPKTIARDLKKLHSLFFVNFFVLGSMGTIRLVLRVASKLDYLTQKYSWFLLTRDIAEIGVPCKTCSLLTIQPGISDECKSRLGKIFGSKIKPELSLSFHFDLYVNSFLSIGQILKDLNGDFGNYITCEEYYKNNTAIIRNRLNLLEELRKNKSIGFTCGNIEYISNGFSHMDFRMVFRLIKILNHTISESKEVATWNSGLNNTMEIKNQNLMDRYTSFTTFRVVVIEEKPLVFKDNNHHSGYNGYCIDILDELAKRMRFKYNITSVDKIGLPDLEGKWNGLIGQLANDDADIGFALYVTAAREEVIDFTVPIFDLVGINIMVKKVQLPDDLFKFVNVFDIEVWFSIILAYFVTSILMWIFTSFKPWYNPSLDESLPKRKEGRKLRIFTLSECLWFCLTSLTAIGGEQAPYKLSGRVLAATWYIFAFIITCAYTANLAAYSTLSREQSSINSLSDLSKQYKMQFAPVKDSAEMEFFRNRAFIESKLYEVWEKMSLNDSLSDTEKADLAVFDYPLSEEYTKIWKIMQTSGFPNTNEEAIERVRNSTSSTEGFALLASSITLNYFAVISCDLLVVGEEFSLKPIAFALSSASPLRKVLDAHILDMIQERVTDELKDKWWANNPEKMTCPQEIGVTDGLSIHSMIGIFLLHFAGIFIACLILVLDYWFLRIKVIAYERIPKKRAQVMKIKSKSDT